MFSWKSLSKVGNWILNILFIISILGMILIIGNYILDQIYINIVDREIQDGKIWSDDYTPLQDFEYYVDADKIYIREYLGNDYKIKLSNYYDINEKRCHITSIDKPYSLFKDARSVVIPEGVESLGNEHYEPYASSETMFLYLPKSLNSIQENIWNSFINLKKVYFGGSEERWNKLTSDMMLPENIKIEFDVTME